MTRIWYGTIIPWTTYSEGTRLASFFSRPNGLGEFMELGTIIAIWLMHKRKNEYIVAVLASILFFWVMVLTLSRTALLGTFVGAYVIVRINRPKLRKLIITFYLLTGIIVIIFTPYGNRFQDLAGNPRLIIWAYYVNATLSSFKKTFFGSGVGSAGRYGTELGTHPIEIGQLKGQLGISKVFFIDNFYVRSFYETGIVGFLYLLWMIGAWWKIYRFAIKNHLNANFLKQNLSLPIAIMAVVLVNSVFTACIGTYPWNFLFWFSASASFYAINDVCSCRHVCKNFLRSAGMISL